MPHARVSINTYVLVCGVKNLYMQSLWDFGDAKFQKATIHKVSWYWYFAGSEWHAREGS